GQHQNPVAVPALPRLAVDPERRLRETPRALLRQPVIALPADLLDVEPSATRQPEYRRPDQSLTDAEVRHDADQAADPHGTAARCDRVAEDGDDQRSRPERRPGAKLLDERTRNCLQRHGFLCARSNGGGGM